jgi:hypothetical protein
MTDIVETVRQGLRKFEHDTKCGLIAVETLAVHREVLIKLCDEIESLRKDKREWVGLTYEEMSEILLDERYQLKPMIVHAVEQKLKEKNSG